MEWYYWVGIGAIIVLFALFISVIALYSSRRKEVQKPYIDAAPSGDELLDMVGKTALTIVVALFMVAAIVAGIYFGVKYWNVVTVIFCAIFLSFVFVGVYLNLFAPSKSGVNYAGIAMIIFGSFALYITLTIDGFITFPSWSSWAAPIYAIIVGGILMFTYRLDRRGRKRYFTIGWGATLLSFGVTTGLIKLIMLLTLLAI